MNGCVLMVEPDARSGIRPFLCFIMFVRGSQLMLPLGSETI